MQISNYDEQLKTGSLIATFSVEMPEIPLTIHKVKVFRNKKGDLFVSLPSYSELQQDGSKKWFPFVSFGKSQQMFNEDVLKQIKGYVQ